MDNQIERGANNKEYGRVLLLMALFAIGIISLCLVAGSCKSTEEKLIKRGAQFGRARQKLIAVHPLKGPLAEIDSNLKWHPLIVGPVKKSTTEHTETETLPPTPPAQIKVNIDSAFKAGAKSVTITCPPCPPQKVITRTIKETDSIPYESTAKLDSQRVAFEIREADLKSKLAITDKKLTLVTKQNVSNHNSAVKWRKRALWTWGILALIIGGAVALKVFKLKLPF